MFRVVDGERCIGSCVLEGAIGFRYVQDRAQHVLKVLVALAI